MDWETISDEDAIIYIDYRLAVYLMMRDYVEQKE